tara:strand:- start:22 stop:468 length:447 start_codon:yes stop_codon:yes gene_type:complete
MKQRQVLGVLGSLLLIVGVFSPVVQMPIIGSIDYFRGGEIDGIIVLTLGAISLGLAFAKKYRWLFLTSIPALAVLLITLIHFQTKISEMKAKYIEDVGDNPFAGIGRMALETVKLDWGWGLLFLGVILVGISAYLEDKPRNQTGDTHE